LIAETCSPVSASLVLPAIVTPLTENTHGSDTIKTLLGYIDGNIDSVFGGVG